MVIRFDKSLSLYEIARAARFIGCRLVNSGSGEIIIMPKQQKAKQSGNGRHLRLVVSNG
jgi:hypothetical protein